MQDLVSSNRSSSPARAGQLAVTVTLMMAIAGGCGSVNSAGGDAAAGSPGHGGHAGDGAGGSTGSAGSTGAAGSGTAGTTASGGSSAGTGGSTGGAAGAGRGGDGGSFGTGGGGATGSAGRGGAGGAAGNGGSTGSAGLGGSTGAAGNGGSTGSGGSVGGRGGSTGGGGAGGTTSPCQAVVALDRSCTTAADCFAGAHTTNCCGQVQFIGFSNSAKTQFQTLEAQCDLTYPLCGCAAQQPTADDGSRLRFSDQAGVTCVQGKCTTFVPDCGKPCGAGTTCFSCSNHNQVFAACTTMCADSSACVDPALPLCQMGVSGNTAGKFCTASNVACDTK
jgi:hypothetical protein